MLSTRKSHFPFGFFAGCSPIQLGERIVRLEPIAGFVGQLDYANRVAGLPGDL